MRHTHAAIQAASNGDQEGALVVLNAATALDPGTGEPDTTGEPGTDGPGPTGEPDPTSTCGRW